MGSRVNLGKVDEDYSVAHAQKRMEADDEYRPLTPMDAPQLPFPMNVNAPQPESPYKAGDGASPHGSHKRRATLPSIALSPAEANALTKYWDRGDGSGSPLAGGPLQSNPVAPDADADDDAGGVPAPLIGLAITSNTIKQKRRSRSADALHEMALQHGLADLPLRRRSAEIKYWRATNRGIPEAEEMDEADAHRSFAATVREVGAFSDSDSNEEEEEDDADEDDDEQDPAGNVATAVSPAADVAIPATDERPSPRPASDPPAARALMAPSPAAPRAHTASPELVTMDRVDQRLSQIEYNMAQLAHSMQVLTVDRGLAPAAAADPERRPSFRLERPPAPKAARSSLEQRPQSRRAAPSLAQRDAAATSTPAPANVVESSSPASGGGNAGSPSPAVLVARSVSLKAPPASRLPRAYHPRQSPSCTDLPVQSAAAAAVPPVADQRSSAASHSVASHSVASGSPPQRHQVHHQQHQQNQLPRASPAPVLNFSNPFAPAHIPSHHHHQQNQQQQQLQQQQREREEQMKQQQLQLQQDQQHSPTRLVEHVAPLYAALAHERGARKRLEAQVGALRGDVAALVAAVGALQQLHIQQHQQQYYQQQHEEGGRAVPGAEQKGHAAAAAAAAAGGTRRSGSSSALGASGTYGVGGGGAVGAWGAAPAASAASSSTAARGVLGDDDDDAEGDDEAGEEEILEVRELRDWRAARRPATPVSSGGWIKGGAEREGGWRESRGEESWREEIF
jgi:hypothetical protein